jgi:hypothetical protein
VCTVHYITLHYTALSAMLYIALHCTALQYITLQNSTTVQCSRVQWWGSGSAVQCSAVWWWGRLTMAMTSQTKMGHQKICPAAASWTNNYWCRHKYGKIKYRNTEKSPFLHFRFLLTHHAPCGCNSGPVTALHCTALHCHFPSVGNYGVPQILYLH